MGFEQLIAEEKNAYLREWRRKNPDRVKQHKENFWRKQVLKKLKAQELGGGKVV